VAALPVAMHTLQAVRAAGISAQMHAGTGEGMGSMKSQFKKADASGAAFALIFGGDELARGEVTVKALRDGQGAQRTERLDAVAQWATRLQSS
jgi:histidyl-tRNA synthetase